MADLNPSMTSLTLQATTPAVYGSCGVATQAITLTATTTEEARAEGETDERGISRKRETEKMPRDGLGITIFIINNIILC